MRIRNAFRLPSGQPMSEHPRSPVAVLASGGLDSAILCAKLCDHHDRVHPIFVDFGLRWEREEFSALSRFLDAVGRPEIAPTTVLAEPIADVYAGHWSLGGAAVPDADSDDREVFLPGRNLLLTAKASVWCALRGIRELALGTLGTNPFPDGGRAFFDVMERAAGIASPPGFDILTPFGGMTKREVMRLGADLPLELTLSCLDPGQGVHCGRCNKCAERRHAFADAGLTDRTPYRTTAAS